MNLRPLHDRVLVKRLEEAGTTASGLFIPDSAKEKPQEGTIVATGDGRVLKSGQRIDLDVQAGDRILFGKYSGSEVTVAGDELIILREDEILAVLG
jgi:chaperonin GroES